MPVQAGKTNGELKKVLALPGSGDTNIDPQGELAWEERLRTTEEKLRMLSTHFPFVWHGIA